MLSKYPLLQQSVGTHPKASVDTSTGAFEQGRPYVVVHERFLSDAHATGNEKQYPHPPQTHSTPERNKGDLLDGAAGDVDDVYRGVLFDVLSRIMGDYDLEEGFDNYRETAASTRLAKWDAFVADLVNDALFLQDMGLKATSKAFKTTVEYLLTPSNYVLRMPADIEHIVVSYAAKKSSVAIVIMTGITNEWPIPNVDVVTAGRYASPESHQVASVITHHLSQCLWTLDADRVPFKAAMEFVKGRVLDGVNRYTDADLVDEDILRVKRFMQLESDPPSDPTQPKKRTLKRVATKKDRLAVGEYVRNATIQIQ